MATTALYNVEVESSALAILLKDPTVWADFHLIGRDDFSEANRPVFDIIALQLNATPPGSLDPMLLTERMKAIGITQLVGGVEIFDYLSGLRCRFAEKKEAPAYARELKRLAVRRELIAKMDEAKKALLQDGNATFEDMTAIVERNLTSITTEYHQSDQFINVFDGFREENERRAANPIDAATMGWMGPFPTINRTLGALTAESLFVCVGARTGNAKSSLGFSYHVHLAETYGMPVLLLDCGEMTRERIRDRAACCLSKGRIPLWAIKSGEWVQNKEWARIMREECYPRADRLRIDHINIGGLSPREKIKLIRRYAYNKVGRGQSFCILDDYLKGIEALGKNTAEYQSIGYYVEDVKNLITNEIPASFWTSVQNNRTGSYQGKKAGDIVDSEDQMGLSDRIIQQSDWGFILRFKVPEEIAAEKGLFGNMKLTCVKSREAMGKEFAKALRPVKLPNGRFVTNAYNLENEGFHFTEKGDLRYMLETLGHAPVTLGGSLASNGAAPI